MKIAVIGAGNIGATLGRAWQRAGHGVTFGVRDPAKQFEHGGAQVADVAAALASAEVVVLAVPASSVDELAAAHAADLAGKTVVDATNRVGAGAFNSLAVLAPAGVRYVRAFSSLGWENFAEPRFGAEVADLFFTAADDQSRQIAEQLIADVGLRPVYVGGDDAVDVVDGVARLWFRLALNQGRGRHLAFRTLTGD